MKTEAPSPPFGSSELQTAQTNFVIREHCRRASGMTDAPRGNSTGSRLGFPSTGLESMMHPQRTAGSVALPKEDFGRYGHPLAESISWEWTTTRLTAKQPRKVVPEAKIDMPGGSRTTQHPQEAAFMQRERRLQTPHGSRNSTDTEGQLSAAMECVTLPTEMITATFHGMMILRGWTADARSDARLNRNRGNL